MKEILRQEMIIQMQELNPDQRRRLQSILFDHLITYLQDNNIGKIGMYWGKFPEIETSLLVDRIKYLGIEVYLARMEKGRQLSFRKYITIDDLEQTSFGIWQPRSTCAQIEVEDLDLVMVPGLIFKKDGYRIGFGGGYYDRLLAKYPLINTISLAFPIQISEDHLWDQAIHDQAVDTIITCNTEGVVNIIEINK